MSIVDNRQYPIHAAAKREDIVVLQVLLENGVKINQENRAKQIPLECIL